MTSMEHARAIQTALMAGFGVLLAYVLVTTVLWPMVKGIVHLSAVLEGIG